MDVESKKFQISKGKEEKKKNKQKTKRNYIKYVTANLCTLWTYIVYVCICEDGLS